MPFERNDYISRYPSSNTLISDIELQHFPSGQYEWIRCELPRQVDEPIRITTQRVYESFFGKPGELSVANDSLFQVSCQSCGEQMLRDPHRESWQADHCQRCLREWKRESNRKSAKSYRESNKHKTAVVHQPIACTVCGALFTPKRSTAKFCSGKCRVAAHRQK